MFGEFLKKLRGYLEMEVAPGTKVIEFEQNFLSVFSVPVKVYRLTNDGKILTTTGARPADKGEVLIDVSQDQKVNKVKKIFIKEDELVGDVEKRIADELGIGIQLFEPDGKDLAKNELSLKQVRDAQPDVVPLSVPLRDFTLVKDFKNAFLTTYGANVEVYKLSGTGKISSGRWAAFADSASKLIDCSEDAKLAKKYGIVSLKVTDPVSKIKAHFRKTYGLGLEFIADNKEPALDDTKLVDFSK
jgi:hypothetical protein